VLAVSGARDSMVLLTAAATSARDVIAAVATFDHGTGEVATRAAAHVVRTARSFGVRVEHARATSPAATEAGWRAARRSFLDAVAVRHGAVVATAHTRDDQAETVLMGLARGSGGRSIAGMRRSFDHYRRPLLDVSHNDTVTACKVEGLEYWEDPHNIDDAYTRVRVRRRVLPVLEDELGPGVTESLARTADLLRADMELLDAYAAEALVRATVDGGLSVEALSACETPIRTRVLREAALATGAPAGETFLQHVVAVDALVTDWHGQKWVDLPGHVRAVRRDGVLAFERADSGA